MKSLVLTLALLATSAVAHARSHVIFNGTDQRATTASPVDLSGSFTIEFWVKRDQARRVEWILGQGTELQNAGLHIGFRGDNRITFAFWGNDLDLEWENLAGQWAHFAFTYDASTLERRIHINGDPFPYATDTATAPYAGSGPLVIGDRPQDAGGNPLDGALDNLRIWMGARTPEQIADSYADEPDPSQAEPALLHHYPLDGFLPGTTTLRDIAGSADAAASAALPVATWREPIAIGEQPDVTQTVTNTDNSGSGSLRDALIRMEALLARAAVINPDESFPLGLVDCSQLEGTITLNTPLRANGRIIIQGSGRTLLALDGQNQTRAIEVTEGSSVVLRDLSVVNGVARGASAGAGWGGEPGLGGAVFGAYGANVRIERVDFRDNSAIGGDSSSHPGNTTGQGNTPGRGGVGGFFISSRRVPTDGIASRDGVAGGDAGIQSTSGSSAFAGQPGSDGADGVHATGFSGGGPGQSAGGGGGGAYANGSQTRGGDGGRGGNGGTGGDGGYGAGGGAGGGGGGGGGAGSNRGGVGSAGRRGDGGTGGHGGEGGFGAADGFPQGADGGIGGQLPNQGPSGGFGGRNGTSGGGGGLGGALFLASRGELELFDVFFANNLAQGGASSGSGFGSAAHLMPGARMTASSRVVFLGNRESGGSADPDGFPIFSVAGPEPTYQILDGSYAPGADPLYYYPAEDSEPGSSAGATFRYRWLLYVPSGDTPAFAYAINAPSDGAPQDPDPAPLFTEDDRANAANARAVLLGSDLAGNTEAENLLLDLCYDTATFDAFLAGFRASQIERDARIIDPAFPYSLDAHIDAYAAPEDGVLALYREAAACYRDIFADPVQLAALERLQPTRTFRPLSFVNGAGQLEPVVPGAQIGNAHADLVLLFELLAGYGDAAHRLAELHLRRDNPGDRKTGLQVAEDAARFLATSSLTLNRLFPANPPRLLADARESWRSSLSRLTDIQSHHLSGINALGFPDDFLLLVGGSSQDSYDTLYPRVESYIADAVDELDTGLANVDTYNAQRDTYRDRLQDLLFGIDDRIAEIGDEDSGLIREQTLRILNANNQIRLNRTEIDNINAEINIEFQLNEELKAANISAAQIRVNYLDRQRALDQEIATIQGVQSAADGVAGLFEPSDPLTKAQKIARGANFLFQFATDAAIADLEVRKHELAGAEILDLARADNVPLDARFRAFGKRRLLDLKRLAVESDIAANLARQEYNRMADLLSERDRLAARRDSLLSPASTPGIPAIDEAIATRYFADPIHQLRADDATSRADTTFRKAQLWMFVLQRALEYKWNQPFEQTDNAVPPRTFTSRDLFAARNARDLDDILAQFEDFDGNREIDFPEGNRNLRTTTFSVREDFFGYDEATEHRDPRTGELVSAHAAFVSRLRQLLDEGGGETITIPFHTVRTKPLRSFFRGAEYLEDGLGGYALRRPGVALDKINWVKIHIEGEFGGDAPTELENSTIRYGGTTFVRRVRVGTIDPDRPDRLIDELVPYETRSYLLSGDTFPPQTFRNDVFDGSVSARVTDNSPGAFNPPASVSARDGFETNNFADRSVAASEWELELTVAEDGVMFPIAMIDDIEFIINHRSADRIEN